MLIQHSPELDQVFGSLKIRQDLINQCVTVGIKPFADWHIDTIEKRVSKDVIHFIEPDGCIVGIKVFSEGE